jgi:hypothetical protein
LQIEDLPETQKSERIKRQAAGTGEQAVFSWEKYNGNDRKYEAPFTKVRACSPRSRLKRDASLPMIR